MDAAALRAFARRRALRAAQIVTISVSLAGGGCGGSATPTDSGTDATVATDLGHGGADGGGADSGGTDAGGTDAGATDALVADASTSDAFVADASLPDASSGDASLPDASVADLGPYDPCADPTTTCGPDDGKCGVTCDYTDPDCCRCIGGFAGPGGSCAIAGPFVPPQMA